MCQSKLKTFLVISVLLLLVVSPLMAWPSFKKATPVAPVIVETMESVEEPVQEQIKEEIAPQSLEMELSEEDKAFLMTALTEVQKSLETSSKETIKVEVGKLELLLAELDRLREGSEVMSEAHKELELSYVNLEDEYDALSKLYGKTQKAKLMLGGGVNFTLDDLGFGADVETGYMTEKYYTTLGIGKDIYSIDNGFLDWDKGYTLSLKFGLLF